MLRFEVGVLSSIPVQYLGTSINVTGQIINHPATQDGEQSFYLRIDTINSKPVAIPYKILIQTFPFPTFEYGAVVQAVTMLTADDSTYLRYLRKDGIVAIGQTRSEVELVDAPHTSLLGGLYQFRDFISQRINTLFPEPSAGLMNGLLLGLRVQLPDDFKDYLKNSGTTHIIALSGFNITIIAGFLLFLARPLRREWALVAAAIGILLFVLMTGASSSVTRAAIMGWIMLLTLWWGRRRHGLNAVLVAGAGMVMINPYILQYDIGFQLSLAATIGIITLVPLITPQLRRVPRVLSEVIATTLAATAMTLPLAAFHFGGVSVIALLANLVVLPLIPWTMLVGFISLVITLVIPWAAVNVLGVITAKLVVLIITWFGSLPFAFLETPSLSVWAPIGYYLGLLIIYWWLCEKKRIRQIYA